jgi:hypothetical protein
MSFSGASKGADGVRRGKLVRESKVVEANFKDCHLYLHRVPVSFVGGLVGFSLYFFVIYPSTGD